jgi:NAD(P)-dependent dehydrogenase (short-subunit alcohol dehydrogenase family)
MIEIKLARLEDVDNIMEFIHLNWKENHILARDKDFFIYEHKDKNIQINAISPSMVETKFLENINEKLVELSAYSHPLKRNAKVEDITPIIQLLISKESDYMNGINIAITGGSVF